MCFVCGFFRILLHLHCFPYSRWYQSWIWCEFHFSLCFFLLLLVFLCRWISPSACIAWRSALPDVKHLSLACFCLHRLVSSLDVNIYVPPAWTVRPVPRYGVLQAFPIVRAGPSETSWPVSPMQNTLSSLCLPIDVFCLSFTSPSQPDSLCRHQGAVLPCATTRVMFCPMPLPASWMFHSFFAVLPCAAIGVLVLPMLALAVVAVVLLPPVLTSTLASSSVFHQPVVLFRCVVWSNERKMSFQWLGSGC